MGNDNISMLYGGVIGLPTTFVIGRDGRIYSKHSGATDVAVFESEIRELLAVKEDAEVAGFETVGRSEKVDLWTTEENNPEVPGVDISHLRAAELTQFKKQLAKGQCDCGCNLSLLKCRLDDRSCGVSRKLAKDELEKFQKSRT
jgi:hypothetical protein